MLKKDVLRLIKQRETESIELKSSLSKLEEIVEVISSLSNTKGGKVLVGVSNTGRILGVKIGEDTVERLTNKIAQNTDPKVQPRISIQEINKKNIIIIDVKESVDKLVLALGRPYKRVGKSTVRMSKDEFVRLILEKHKDKLRFDNQICEGASYDDIDEKKVSWFLKKAKTKRGLDIDENLPIEEILMRLKLGRNKKLTNAAILLFGKPQNFFIQSEVKCIRFKGTDVTGKMIDLRPIGGNVIDQVIEAEKFIYDHINMTAWIESGKIERQEKWEYPPKAIREVLANAIAHRDYWSVSKVQVRIFDDRMEFWNPGRLPEGWTVKILKEKHESIPPNPLIARHFFWIKYVEEVGTGTNKMIRWCIEWGLPEPDFEYTGTSLVVTFRKSKLTEEYLETLNLNERQMKALEFLKFRQRGF
ncbi:hypothetical protein ES703_79146 [subsurface metagenome]